jgi:hypothetical protein
MTLFGQRATLPSLLDVRGLMEDLMGREVEAHLEGPWSPSPGEGFVAAEYVNDMAKLAVVAFMDHPLAVCTGSAVGLLPPGGAQDLIDENRLSQGVIDNLYEVFNILTSAFNKENSAHVRITEMHIPGERLPIEVASALSALDNRLDARIDIAGYGGGRMGFVLSKA